MIIENVLTEFSAGIIAVQVPAHEASEKWKDLYPCFPGFP